MIKLCAETPRDQKIVDALKKAGKWKDKKIEELKKELDEYKKRHPANVGVKNGKPYVITAGENKSHEALTQSLIREQLDYFSINTTRSLHFDVSLIY